MLEAYIIDALRQEELERERHAEAGRRVWLEIPEPSAWYQDPQTPAKPEPESDRGIITIPLHPGVE